MKVNPLRHHGEKKHSRKIIKGLLRKVFNIIQEEPLPLEGGSRKKNNIKIPNDLLCV